MVFAHFAHLRGSVAWTNEVDLLAELRASAGGKQEYPAFVQSAALLVVDDFGKAAPTPFLQEQMFRLVNGRYQRGLLMLLASELTFDELEERRDPALVGRLREVCRPVGIRGEDRRKAARR